MLSSLVLFIEIANLKSFLDKQLSIKDLGRLHYFLGLEVLYKSDGVIISQRKFTLDLLKEYDCFDYSNLSSPLDPAVKLKADEGGLLLVILFWLETVPLAGNPRNKKPFPCPQLKKYRSLRKLVGELVWLIRLFEEFTIPQSSPITVFCDSQSAIHIAHNPVFHERTEHIEVDCHFVMNKLQEGLISLQHVATTDQLADILTKALTGVKHNVVLGKLVVRSSHPT
uniref:Uncharacterized protein LOC104231698 n=1 Tax=Nicotiana sylvestris TaxID=4096 RepID=A0A1U7X9D2_NICSY|nr:PREDICTED: uncharacterized protein LOC104231698 [Nicotiana sylvestris]